MTSLDINARRNSHTYLSMLSHVVIFGMVLKGFKVVDQIELVGTNGGEPMVEVVIESSGVLPLVDIKQQ